MLHSVYISELSTFEKRWGENPPQPGDFFWCTYAAQSALERKMRLDQSSRETVTHVANGLRNSLQGETIWELQKRLEKEFPLDADYIILTIDSFERQNLLHIAIDGTFDILSKVT